MPINSTDAAGLFTTQMTDIYDEKIPPRQFLRSFFRTDTRRSLNLSIMVRRGSEKLSPDVLRGTEGNRRSLGKSSQKIYEPPYYREYLEATSLSFYTRLWRDETNTIDAADFNDMVSEAKEELDVLRHLIERSYELQIAQVFQTGVVSLINGDDINYHRKALSMVDLTPNYWDTAINPITSVITGCKFLRQVGKMIGGTVTMIAGSDAVEALINNADFQNKADLKDFDLMLINEPQRNAEGGVFHGRFTAGAWKINLWSYPEFYDDESDVSTPFIDDNKVVMIPDQGTKFTMGFASVPMIMATNNEEMPKVITQNRGEFTIGNFVDEQNTTHEFDIRSAGLAIPVTIDMIYTIQVLA